MISTLDIYVKTVNKDLYEDFVKGEKNGKQVSRN